MEGRQRERARVEVGPRAVDDDEPWIVDVLLRVGAVREAEIRNGSRRLADDVVADQFLRENEFALLVGILAQQHRTRAGSAWGLPWRAHRVLGGLGGLDPARIAASPDSATDTLRSVGGLSSRMVTIIVRAAQSVVSDFDGDASRVWCESASAAEIAERVRRFYGAGPKIAAMAPAVLSRFFGVAVEGAGEIAVDANVLRVFERTGLVDRGASHDAIRSKARSLVPDAAMLDLGAWAVGAAWCRAKPQCSACALSARCRKQNL